MIWNCKDKKIEYGDRVLLMGIVNITPDSFSDGGDSFSTEAAVSCALRLIDEGADIIDLGAQSTRPDCVQISPDEEWSRLEPVLSALNGRITVPVSVDTFYPEVALRAVRGGADIINDVSGVVSCEMAKIVENERCGWIIMHNGAGTPEDVRAFFENSIEKCRKLGINDSQLCFDIGIGFGKNYEENMRLLTHIDELKLNGFPLLLGVSRKRVIGQGSGQDNPRERVFGNIAADTAAIAGGVDIIRLHDIEYEKQGIRMAEELRKFR